MTRNSTNYRELRNRCPNCGHRLDMVSGTRCTVVNGEIPQREEIPCICRNHKRG